MTNAVLPHDLPTDLSGAHQVVHCYRDDALGTGDATEVAQRIASGQISPAEAVDAAIERVRSVDPYLHAVAHTDFERAEARAARPTTGVFAGVPTATKDNLTVGGVPMTQGSASMPVRPQEKDGAFTRQFLATGAIPIAVTTMPPFGWTATTEGPGGKVTRNPWDTAYSSGGSSGGSAALVASGALPFAHGNDGGGSLRIPGAACGLVALKATRGRFRNDPTNDSLPIQLISNGVLTRSVRDTATFIAALQTSYRNPRLPEIPRIEGPNPQRRRIGLLIDSPVGVPTDEPTRNAVMDLAHRLEAMGHTVEPFTPKLPDFFQGDFETYWGFLAWTIARHGKLTMSPQFDASALDPITLGLSTQAFRARHLPLAMARLRASSIAYERQLRGYDAVLSPTLAHTTPVIGYLGGDLPFEEHYARLLNYCAFTPVHNATGAPAINLPTGQTADGRPIGTMLQGHRGDEKTLLELAFEIEGERSFALIGQ